MSLSTRITLAMVALSLLTALAGGIFIHVGLESRLRPVLLDQMTVRTVQLTNAVDATIRAAQADVLAILASQPLQGLMTATMAGSDGSAGGFSREQWRLRIEANFLAQMGAKPGYDQMRVIGVDHGGRELVRVDRSGDQGAVRAVPEEGLQAKGDRGYFKEAIELGRGQIYLGRVELNQEHGNIQTPHVPVLRVAAPIHQPDGEIFGIVVVNIDLRDTFRLIQSLAGDTVATYVVNRAGDYLLHPDPSMAFGFEFGTPRRLQHDYPDMPALESIMHASATVTNALDGRPMALALAPVPPAGSDTLIVAQAEAYANLMQPLGTVESATALAALASAVIALIAALLLSRSLSRPLRRVVDQLEQFRHGDPATPVRRGPVEIVALSGALAGMSAEIRERTTALEQEIAVRRRTEAALEDYVEKMRLFTAVVESSDDAILSTDLECRITTWNPAAARLYGFTEAEAVGQPVSIIIPEDRREEHATLMSRLLRGEGTSPIQTVRRHKNGRLIDVSLSLSPIIVDDGAIVGASAIARDISRRLVAEEKFRLVVEASPNGIVMVDGQGRIQLINTETERLFGYTRDELTGQPMEILVPPRFRVHHPGMRDSYTAEPTTRSMGEGRELFGLRRDGTEFPIEVGLNPITTREGMMVLSVIVDITERKRAEAEIQRHTEDLQRSNRELETFAYAASHDLQEPLRMVASYVELLAKRYQGKLDEKADKYIFYAVDGATRMKQLINDLLAYSRVSTQGKPLVPVESNAVLAQVLRGLEALIRDAGGTVTSDPLPTVMADPIQLGQVFQNLIGNGLKFRGTNPPQVHVSASEAGDFCEFQVRDNGIGIDPRYAERVFQMFQRLNTREEYAGTGIGLAIAHKIVERHGGRIWFDAAEGGGTTFHFTIRRA